MDADEFHHLYRSEAGRVFALCLRLTADAEAAGELTQEVFVHLWRKRGAMDGVENRGAWVRRVAVNVALNRLRSERRRLRRVAPVEDLERLAPPPRVTTDQTLALEAAIGALPPGARAALVMHDIEGYKIEEIATMTGTTGGSVKSQLHRARGLLRKALGR